MAARPAASEGEIHAREVRLALNGHVGESLRPLTLGLGLLWFFFAILDGVFAVREPRLPLALTDAAVAGVLLGFRAYIQRHPTPPEHAHAWLGVLGGVVLLDIVFVMALIPTADLTLFLILYAIGMGCIVLSTPWLGAFLGAAVGAWLPFVVRAPGAEWATFGIGLSASLVLAFTFHLVRKQALERVERLRLEDSRRKAELEIREEALQGAVQAAQESEERYRRLVENAPDAFLVHSQGKVVYANAAAARLFGAETSDQLLGMDAMGLVHPDHVPEVMARMALVEREGQPAPRMETKMLRLDGTPVDVEVSGQPIVFAGHPADQTVIRDLTDRIQVEQERALNAKRAAEIDRLRELDRLKTQFVNTLSHELRTPLTPIKVQLHILKNAPPEGDARARAMDMLERNLTRLGSLIDEFLEVARIQSGALKLARARHEAGAIVAEAVESFHDVARTHGVRLETAFEKDLWADVDPKRLSQVVYNLVGNAMKFTPRGGSIRVEATRRSDAVTVQVHDTGAGLRAEDIAKLFEPFSQAHDTMQKTNSGTGLGLYICRGIVESHGGRIWCESAGPGKGSTFAFAIPAAEGPLADPPVAKTA